jgi:putative membrane protein
MHPFYDPSRELSGARETPLLGLASMAAYLLFWAAAIPLALRLLARSLGRSPLAPAPDRSEAILRERYAAGEIDADEFRRRLRDLRST